MSKDRAQITIKHSTNAFQAGYLRLQTHTQNMLTLLLFPLKQWLHKRASMLQYTYIACLVSIQFVVLLSFDTVLSRA